MYEALNKIKNIGTHQVNVKGKTEEHFDPETLPPEMLKRPSEIEIQASNEVYREHMSQKAEAQDKVAKLNAKIAKMPPGRKRDRLIERARQFEKIANSEPSLPNTRPAVNQHSVTGMLISAIKELTERIEALEER
jgi:hypothetical protein